MRHYIDLITVLTQKEMKIRYKSSFLGYVWSILNPLAFAFIFFVIFKVVMRIQIENYTLFLITGLFPWQWFSNSVNMSPGVFLTNASIIKKVNFPRNLTLLAIVLQDMIHFVLAIPVIVFFMFIYQKQPSISWLYGIPLLLGIQLFMTYGIALAISSINLFFRDLERLTTIFTMFLFYVTPIIYPVTMIPTEYRYLIDLNPLAPLMISWRNLFLEGTLKLELLAISLAYGVAAYTAGYFIYKKLSWKFAEVL
jgi:homopolymeric O-antigen transport system permease protein